MAQRKAAYYVSSRLLLSWQSSGSRPRAWLLVCFFVSIFPLDRENQNADLQTVRKVTLFIQLVNCV